MTNPAIEFRQVTKSYGRFAALRGIDLEVRSGEVFGFLGPNGAGKTTAIRCLLDLIRPGSGSVRVLGLDPQKDAVEVRRRTGYLPGELSFDDNLTAGQALKWFDRFRGGSADWVFVRALAGRLRLDLDKAIRNFSKGNKQKVGVIQAFMHRPELLLLDEPTSGLDPLMQQVVLQLVREARDGGATVFFSTHVLGEAQDVTERLAILRDGAIIETGETSSLTGRGLLKVRIELAVPAGREIFEGAAGVMILEECERRFFTVQVEGEMDGLLKQLAGHHVRSLETERATLEDVFLNYYGEKEEASAK